MAKKAVKRAPYKRKRSVTSPSALVGDVVSDPTGAMPDLVPEGSDGVFSTIETGTWDADLLAVERAIKHPQTSVWEFLTEKKGLSKGQAIYVLRSKPADDWENEKTMVLDRITENVVKRHIDLIAEVQETHIKASKLSLAKSLEMLSKLPVHTEDEFLIDDKGQKKLIKKRVLRSIDLVNCTNAIQTAQNIYRRAMGLPNDDGGLQQILDKVQQVAVQNTQINIHNHEAPKSDLEVTLSKLSYDQVVALIEMKRERSDSEEKSSGEG